jgi:hypothetical protein
MRRGARRAAGCTAAARCRRGGARCRGRGGWPRPWSPRPGRTRGRSARRPRRARGDEAVDEVDAVAPRLVAPGAAQLGRADPGRPRKPLMPRVSQLRGSPESISGDAVQVAAEPDRGRQPGGAAADDGDVVGSVGFRRGRRRRGRRHGRRVGRGYASAYASAYAPPPGARRACRRRAGRPGRAPPDRPAAQRPAPATGGAAPPARPASRPRWAGARYAGRRRPDMAAGCPGRLRRAVPAAGVGPPAPPAPRRPAPAGRAPARPARRGPPHPGRRYRVPRGGRAGAGRAPRRRRLTRTAARPRPSPPSGGGRPSVCCPASALRRRGFAGSRPGPTPPSRDPRCNEPWPSSSAAAPAPASSRSPATAPSRPSPSRGSTGWSTCPSPTASTRFTP